jgi:hypothetical protein
VLTFIEQIKAARRVSVPFLTVITSDQNATILNIGRALHAAVPMLSWDIVRGITPLNTAAQSYLETFEQDPAMMTNPVEVLNKAALLSSFNDDANEHGYGKGQPIGPILFMHNLHLFLNPDSRIDESARISILQGILNLRDLYKENRRTLIILAPQMVMPQELGDMIVLDEPLPDKQQLAAVITDIYKQTGVKEPDEKTRAMEIEAVMGTPSTFLAEQISAMCITKNGLNLGDLRQRKRKQVEQTKGCSMWSGDEIEIAGNEQFLTFMDRYLVGPDRPGAMILLDEIGDSMAGNAGDNTGVSQDIHKAILTFMEDNKVPGIMEVGVPGVGKTHGPKALANKHNIPLILADIGAMKEGEVGRSEGNVRAFLKLALAVSGGKLLAIGTTNSTANLSPQLMSRFRYTFMFDIPGDAGRKQAWKIYIKEFGLTPKQTKEMPDDKNWTPREIRNCCESARALEYTLKQAAEFVCPVYRSGAVAIAKLRAEAHGRYLSDSKPGFYEQPKVELRPGGRAIAN